MSRVTKTVAREMAEKLAKPHYDRMKELSKRRSDGVRAVYTAGIPKAIIDASRHFPEWINSFSSVYVHGAGLNKSFQVDPMVIGRTTSQGSASFKADNDQSDAIQKITLEYENAKRDYDDILLEIENALINLRTFKNIEKEFPEAVPHLPTSNTNTSLMVNIDGLRAKLKV